MSRKAATRRPAGWVPQQHGAWAMLVVPYLVGAGMALRRGASLPWLAALGCFWLLGYFAFNAAILGVAVNLLAGSAAG